MPAFAGRDLVLSVQISGSYQPVGGLRARSIKIDENNVDVTTADSSGRWRELLAGAAVRSLDIDATGIWQRDVGAKGALAAFVAGSTITARVAWPSAGLQFDATFLIDSMSFDAPYNDAGSFSIKLASAGAVTITAS